MLSKAIKTQLNKADAVAEKLSQLSIDSDISKDLIEDAMREFTAIKNDSSLSNGESLIQIYYQYKIFEKRYIASDEGMKALTAQRREYFDKDEGKYQETIVNIQSKINQLQITLF
jgi:hypothetical protein